MKIFENPTQDGGKQFVVEFTGDDLNCNMVGSTLAEIVRLRKSKKLSDHVLALYLLADALEEKK